MIFWTLSVRFGRIFGRFLHPKRMLLANTRFVRKAYKTLRGRTKFEVRPLQLTQLYHPKSRKNGISLGTSIFIQFGLDFGWIFGTPNAAFSYVFQ